MKIVSLLPGATEIVYALGLGDDLVAVSHECDFPSAATHLPAVTRALVPSTASSAEIDRIVRERIGSQTPLYSLDAEALIELAPDVIVTQALCNVCAVSDAEVHAVARRMPRPPEIVSLETRTLSDLLVGIRLVAERTGSTRAGEDLASALQRRITRVETRTARRRRDTRVAFIEWLEPIFACGHWNPELISMSGGCDPFGRRGEAARTIAWSDVAAFRPELIFVAACGFTVERTLDELSVLTGREGWSDLPAVQGGRVFVADGTQYFSRPGPRLVDSLEMLAHAIDPELHALPSGVAAAQRVSDRRLNPSAAMPR